jgi:aminocarboxymuconate-semialdehyde decarboxylase
MKIDFHIHYFPEEYIRFLEKKGFKIELREDQRGRLLVNLFNYTIPLLSPEEQIGIMEQLGVDMQVLSLPIPSIYLTEIQDALESARMINDCFARICHQYPQRFKSLACIPLNAGEGALKELDRALNELHMNGVFLSTNINGKPLNSPEFLPFFEELNRLKVPVLLHPVPSTGAEALYSEDYYLMILVGFPFETTLAATRMVFSGIFEKLKDIRLILAHMGGALPYLFERIDYGYRELEACRAHISSPPSEYFQRFYYETALSYHKPAMICAYQSVGADHILLGSDHPFVPTELAQNSISIIESLELSKEEKEEIYYKNAQRILNLP